MSVVNLDEAPGFVDLSDSSYRIASRVNAALTAVPGPGPDAADTRAPPGGRLFLFGGDDGTNARGDLWIHDIASGRWESETALKGEKPSARSRHTLSLVRYHREETQLEEDRLYLYGIHAVPQTLCLHSSTRCWAAPAAGQHPLLPSLTSLTGPTFEPSCV